MNASADLYFELHKLLRDLRQAIQSGDRELIEQKISAFVEVEEKRQALATLANRKTYPLVQDAA